MKKAVDKSGYKGYLLINELRIQKSAVHTRN